MAKDFADIRRYFRDIKEEIYSASSRAILRTLSAYQGLVWEDLLLAYAKEKAPRIVVLESPSGAGKTTELQAQTHRMVEQRLPAFLILAKEFYASRQRPNKAQARLREWAAGDISGGTLFIDALDEIPDLAGSFDDLVDWLKEQLGPTAGWPQIVFSIRTGMWRRGYASRLRALFPAPAASDQPSKAQEASPNVAKRPRLKRISFEPLDAEAIKTVAISHGLAPADATRFVEAFQERDLEDLFDINLIYVSLLVRTWQHSNDFGGWAELLEGFVRLAISERNPSHQTSRQLTSEEAERALERLAAATVLGRQPLLHQASYDEEEQGVALSTEKLLRDLSLSKHHQLLSSVLFSPKGDGIYQLPQGAMTDYLAARWLAKTVAYQDPNDLLDEFFFYRPFGETQPRINEGRRSLLGWLASLVPDYRKPIAQVYPAILLHEGDPAKLTTGEIELALSTHVANLKDERDGYPSNAAIRMLARPQLEPLVRRLLEQASSSAAKEYLFGFVRAGGYLSCAGLALGTALDGAQEEDARISALRALARISSQKEKSQLLSLTETSPPPLQKRLLRILCPDFLSGQALVKFVLQAKYDSLTLLPEDSFKGVATEDLLAILSSLEPSILSSMEDATTSSRLEVSSLAVLEILQRKAPLPDGIGPLLVAIEAHANHTGHPSFRNALSALVASNKELSRAYWTARIEAVEWKQQEFIRSTPLILPFLADASWLHALADKSGSTLAQYEANRALERAFSQASEQERSKTLLDPALPATLKTQFGRLTAPHQPAPPRKRSASKVEKVVIARLEALQGKESIVSSGTDRQALEDAHDYLWQSSNNPESTDLKPLRKRFGSSLATALDEGFKAFWRHYDPPLPSSYETADVTWGAIGLSLDVASGLDLASLSQREALKALRYGLRPRNKPHRWLSVLADEWPDEFIQTLSDALTESWASSQPRAMSWTYNLPRKIKKAILSISVSKLSANQIPKTEAAERRLCELILEVPRIDPSVARVVAPRARLAEQNPQADDLAWHYLCCWPRVAPLGCSRWLEGVRQRNQATFQTLLTRLTEFFSLNDGSRKRRPASDFGSAKAQARWCRLLLLNNQQGGTQQRQRGRQSGQARIERFTADCLEKLARHVSPEGRRELLKLRQDPCLSQHSMRLAWSLDAQAIYATEAHARPWTEEDVLRKEGLQDPFPRSQGELHDLTLRHLRRLARLAKGGDFTHPDLFSFFNRREAPEDKVANDLETQVQLWTAWNLEFLSSSLYSVKREPHSQASKRMDIITERPGIPRLPIEVKVARNWSLKQLTKEAIVDQLIGRYMKDTTHIYGILLLVRVKRGEEKWSQGAHPLTWRDLLKVVQQFASREGLRLGKVIEVVGLDLCGSEVSL